MDVSHPLCLRVAPRSPAPDAQLDYNIQGTQSTQTLGVRPPLLSSTSNTSLLGTAWQSMKSASVRDLTKACDPQDTVEGVADVGHIDPTAIDGVHALVHPPLGQAQERRVHRRCVQETADVKSGEWGLRQAEPCLTNRLEMYDDYTHTLSMTVSTRIN
jgi:hypothetical protein